MLVNLGEIGSCRTVFEDISMASCCAASSASASHCKWRHQNAKMQKSTFKSLHMNFPLFALKCQTAIKDGT